MHTTSAPLASDGAATVDAVPRTLPRPRTRQPTLAVQFLVTNLLVLVASMAVIGSWVGAQLEAGVFTHTGETAAFYVDGVLSPRLQVLATKGTLDESEMAQLDWLLSAILKSHRVVAAKVWSPDGTILYSPNRELVGRRYPLDEDLSGSLAGNVNANISDLQDEENEFERAQYSRLLQVYAPVHQSSTGNVIAVTEFYQPPDELDAEVAAVRGRSWLLVGAVTAVAYLLLAGLVKRGSDTIVRQGALLRQQFVELSTLHERLRHAAARATTLNEQALRRISADLHDGPGQTLALALLRLDNLARRPSDARAGALGDDFGVVQGAVRDALTELRTISASLRVPELDRLTVSEIAERATAAHERRTGARVTVRTTNLPDDAPLPIKIALMRTLQEALSNATRHGGGNAPIEVEILRSDDMLRLSVTDHGRGFDPANVPTSGHLGLIGMRERAELLGGTFEIQSHPGDGTVVHVCWPLSETEEPWAIPSASS